MGGEREGRCLSPLMEEQPLIQVRRSKRSRKEGGGETAPKMAKKEKERESIERGTDLPEISLNEPASTSTQYVHPIIYATVEALERREEEEKGDNNIHCPLSALNKPSQQRRNRRESRLQKEKRKRRDEWKLRRMERAHEKRRRRQMEKGSPIFERDVYIQALTPPSQRVARGRKPLPHSPIHPIHLFNKSPRSSAEIAAAVRAAIRSIERKEEKRWRKERAETRKSLPEGGERREQR